METMNEINCCVRLQNRSNIVSRGRFSNHARTPRTTHGDFAIIDNSRLECRYDLILEGHDTLTKSRWTSSRAIKSFCVPCSPSNRRIGVIIYHGASNATAKSSASCTAQPYPLSAFRIAGSSIPRLSPKKFNRGLRDTDLNHRFEPPVVSRQGTQTVSLHIKKPDNILTSSFLIPRSQANDNSGRMILVCHKKI